MQLYLIASRSNGVPFLNMNVTMPQIKFTIMINTKYIYLLTACLCIAGSCKKQEDDNRHRDIVTATINGKPWKARCKESPPFGCSIGNLQYYTDSGRIELIAGDGIDGGKIQIILNEVLNPGLFKMRQQTQCGIINKGEPCGVQRHYINENDPQEIEIINIDQESKIIEGRFHFIGRDTVCNSDPLHVTNGYFKMKYRP